MIMEVTIGAIQTLFLFNELVALYCLKMNVWLVNVYIDSCVFVMAHLFNYMYYKIKCREYSLLKQTLLEMANLLVSLIMIFLLF
jgi:hypothetical protein